MIRHLAPLIALGACGSPPLTIKLQIADGPAQTCPQTSCSGITMSCDPWVSVRVLDPHDPTAPFVSVCKEVLLDRNGDLCSLGAVELPSGVSVPEITLEVQVVVYPRSQLTTDPMTGDVVCPTNIEFDDATGAPVEGMVSPGMLIGQPAIGGRAYYHAGDAETVVPLGCTDLTLLDGCSGNQLIPIQATVDDFTTRLSVESDVAPNLTVKVGEPHPVTMGNTTVFEFDPTAPTLDLVAGEVPPAWGGDVNVTFESYVCLEVLAEGFQETTTASCIPAPAARAPGTPIQVLGERLTKPDLDPMLAALGMAFPSEGLVVGIVIDDAGNPVPGMAVTTPGQAATIRYLDAAGTGTTTTRTAASGVWFSTDAPFGTTFSSTASPTNVATAVGGIIENRVTIVVLQFPPPVGN